MTKPDSKRSSVTGRKQSRLDATLGFQNVSYDVARCQLKYTSRLELFFFDFYKCINNFQLIFEFHRKALKCLKDVPYGNKIALVANNSYEVKSSSLNSNGYLQVWIMDELNRSSYYPYSCFEDMAFHRDDLLSSLFG